MSEFGLHLTIDASQCNKRNLTSQSVVYDILNKMPENIGMTKMTLPYVAKWIDKFSTSTTPGISGFVMLAESHISIHTFPDYDYAFIDIFSCKSFDAEDVARQFAEVFEAKKVTKNIIKRGLDFPAKVYSESPSVVTEK
tara:strand:- start:14222 stop:14638 length:417 start_codon:yes stop_codon:yes gene_type:complete